jgi:hypothetical protein
MLIVHQFQAEMITDPSAIERRGDVDLVIDMDGYGPADIKKPSMVFGAACTRRLAASRSSCSTTQTR